MILTNAQKIRYLLVTKQYQVDKLGEYLVNPDRTKWVRLADLNTLWLRDEYGRFTAQLGIQWA